MKKPADLKRSPHDKLFRGCYEYLKNDNMYCEEQFEIYHDKKENSYNFVAELMSRVSTGELLKIFVDLTVNKDYIPQFLKINRILGSDDSTEYFDFNSKRNIITYVFANKDGEVKKEFATTPKFHISTPAASTSMIYLRSKKFNSTGKNTYALLTSHNTWKFDELPSFKKINVEKLELGAQNLTINKQSVSAIEYRLTEYVEDQQNQTEQVPHYLSIHLSKHMTLPYLIRNQEGINIQIKFLNDLTAVD